MSDRKLINDNIVKWIENRVKTKFPNDISMVLLYGSYMNGTANDMSDVDCYFIPKAERGCEMAVDFILEGVGYDIFPMSWERVERIANLEEALLPCVGDVRILYYHTGEDLARFENLQEKMRQNLNDTVYINKMIQGRWQNACDMYREMKALTQTTEIRKLAGRIIMTLAEIIAFANHDYFHCGLKKQYEDLQCRFSKVPEQFAKAYADVVQAADNAASIQRCYTILKITADYLHLQIENTQPDEKAAPSPTPLPQTAPPQAPQAPQPQPLRQDYAWLAGLYEEISSTFNKIYVCCGNDNYILAYLSAVCLQYDLDEAVSYGAAAYDLLGAYDYRNPGRLYDKAKEIERDYVERLSEGGAVVKSYNSFEEFVKAGL